MSVSSEKINFNFKSSLVLKCLWLRPSKLWSLVVLVTKDKVHPPPPIQCTKGALCALHPTRSMMNPLSHKRYFTLWRYILIWLDMSFSLSRKLLMLWCETMKYIFICSCWGWDTTVLFSAKCNGYAVIYYYHNMYPSRTLINSLGFSLKKAFQITNFEL